MIVGARLILVSVLVLVMVRLAVVGAGVRCVRHALTVGRTMP
ncbi:hypothetical protein [Actinopolymorpha rutila]|uniref:Uncharacterized protein n=1 Tax=Actinopolymorpha rutila TaxID=446787 RepID=A0A852ZBT5_9ACTN|nr:hypothetical protein [Actinopolymorpha rutila]NYH90374.1 hypothetical protein [Actinopolymorpha rutila]